ALAAARSGIDAEVGEQAVLRRDARQHPRLMALRPRLGNRVVRRLHENAGMAVERRAHPFALAHWGEDALGHLGVRLRAVTTLAVAVVEGLCARVELAQPFLSHTVVHEKEQLLGRLHGRQGLLSHLSGEQHAGSHARQRAFWHQRPPQEAQLVGGLLGACPPSRHTELDRDRKRPSNCQRTSLFAEGTWPSKICSTFSSPFRVFRTWAVISRRTPIGS